MSKVSQTYYGPLFWGSIYTLVHTMFSELSYSTCFDGFRSRLQVSPDKGLNVNVK